MRISSKIGDVFCVNLANQTKKYFQYVANDLLQLNSDVIRAYRTLYQQDSNPELFEIINDQVDFTAHCVIKSGLKMGVWEKFGNISVLGPMEVMFRCSNDYGSRPGEQVEVSENWRIWKIGDDDFTRVGALKGENQTAEIGVVVAPIDVLTRMETGQYSFRYPKF